MKAKNWLFIWLAIVLAGFFATGICVCHVDPCFHYHKPYTEKYFYTLDNERSQNDGIIIEDLMNESFSADGIFHMYAVDLSSLRGTVRVVFNGSPDGSVNSDPAYAFSDIFLF